MFIEKTLNLINLTPQDIYHISDIVYFAGQKAKQNYEIGHLEVKEKGSPDDLVTRTDNELSDYLIKELKTRFPKDSIISEEAPPSNINKSNRIWVIDPLDGTENYVHNDGQYSVMIGLLKDGKPLAGWVYSPIWDKLIIGIPGAGVYERLGQGEIKTKEFILKDQIKNKPMQIMIGRRNLRDHPELKKLMDHFEYVSMGSLGLKVIYILENKADLFIHTIQKLKLWDTVAPSAIALAAKMHLSTLEDDPFIFSPDVLNHQQSYVVGKKWAFDLLKAHL